MRKWREILSGMFHGKAEQTIDETGAKAVIASMSPDQRLKVGLFRLAIMDVSNGRKGTELPPSDFELRPFEEISNDEIRERLEFHLTGAGGYNHLSDRVNAEEVMDFVTHIGREKVIEIISASHDGLRMPDVDPAAGNDATLG